jgi:hypothetical protein
MEWLLEKGLRVSLTDKDGGNARRYALQVLQ